MAEGWAGYLGQTPDALKGVERVVVVTDNESSDESSGYKLILAHAPQDADGVPIYLGWMSRVDGAVTWLVRFSASDCPKFAEELLNMAAHARDYAEEGGGA